MAFNNILLIAFSTLAEDVMFANTEAIKARTNILCK